MTQPTTSAGAGSTPAARPPSAARRRPRIGPSGWYRGLRLARLGLPVLLAVATLVLGTAGFAQLEPVPYSPAEALLQAAGLLTAQTTFFEPGRTGLPATLQAARVTGLLTLAWTFVLLVLFAFRDRFMSCWIRCCWRRGGYAVVCGLGWQGRELVEDLRNPKRPGRPRRVVVIEKDRASPFVSSVVGSGVIVFIADATSLAALRLARVAEAEKVYVVCQDDETSCRILSHIQLLVQRRREGRQGRWLHLPGRRELDLPRACYVHLDDPRSRSVLPDVAGATAARPGGVFPEVHPFNTESVTARRLLERHPLTGVLERPPDGGDRAVHVVVLGATRMARAILLQTLRLAHFPRSIGLEVTWACADAARARQELLAEHPCLAACCRERPEPADLAGQLLRGYVFPDLEGQPFLSVHELPVSPAGLLDPTSFLLRSLGPGRPLYLNVCVDDGFGSIALLTALAGALDTAVAERGARAHVNYFFNYPEDQHLPVIQDALARKLATVGVFGFGNFLEERASVELVEAGELDALARRIHEGFCRRFGLATPWLELSEETRDSNRQAADHVAVKLWAAGLTADEAAADRDRARRALERHLPTLAEVEHRRWCAAQLLAGWRPCPDRPGDEGEWRRLGRRLRPYKLHLDLRPFADLPDFERAKDDEQILAIPDLLRGSPGRA